MRMGRKPVTATVFLRIVRRLAGSKIFDITWFSGGKRILHGQRLFMPAYSPIAFVGDWLRYWTLRQPNEPAFAYWSGKDDDSDTSLSYEELDRRAQGVAAELLRRLVAGGRALLLYPPGLEFVTALFGCFFAEVVAVPACLPRWNRNRQRLEGICKDSQPAIILSTEDVATRTLPAIPKGSPLWGIPWLATETLPDGFVERQQTTRLAGDTPAILQYTSGSTGTPKGVIVTHANLAHNSYALMAHGFQPGRTSVELSWLPAYHDMGLVGGVLGPVFLGLRSVLMNPLAFLQKPVRWLRGISRFRATISGGPNFAYALCNEKIAAADCAGLDLQSWSVAFNGAEPIRAETLETFTRKFAPYGFRAEAHYPCYGMAEATLMITGGVNKRPPVVRDFDAAALEENRAVPVQSGQATGRRLVGCGRTLLDEEVIVVNPQTRRRLPQDRIGEIWVSGPSVASGYWNKPGETAKTFRARLARGGNRHYLRTGDLGFFHEDELFVTGRLKDLIIIRGRNIYPQDIERTVEDSHPALQPRGCGCFSVDEGVEERLVVAQEVRLPCRETNFPLVIEAICQAVLETHEVSLYGVVLLKSGGLPKTSSGKVRRRECRNAYIEDRLEACARWRCDEETRQRQDAEPESPRVREANRSREDGALRTERNRSSTFPEHQSGSPSAAGLGETPCSTHATNSVHITELQAQGTRFPLTAAEIVQWLVTRLASRLGRRPAEIDVYQAFTRFGLDSLALVELSGELEKFFGRSVSPTVLYAYPTIALLVENLAGAPSGSGTDCGGRQAWPDEAIAIVGMACRFPKAGDLGAFWKLLAEGTDAIDDIPAGRWNLDACYDPDPAAPGKMYVRKGGFLDGVELFDPQFFGIAPREAPAIDPQQRLLLEIAWETLENAGETPERLARQGTGVFIGVSNCDYARVQGQPRSAGDIDAYTAAGTAVSVAAGRLSYFLGLHGPCLAVDTACSSSLAAVHLAVGSLRSGECRAALAGGVNLILDPSSMIALCRLQALAPDGRSKAFDAAADGYARGEGCGMVLLKRLSHAVEDRDRIWAVVRGTAMNHDGHSNGLTAPHGPSQEALLRAAMTNAGVRAGDVGFIEAHGTGTSLGDPIEVQAIAAAVGAERTAAYPLLLGSVKTNVGHLESAAGIAGLIKTVLALQHGQIPANLHFKNPNPYIPWDTIPLVVPTRLTPWPAEYQRRIAGVSSFGFSGTNVHVVLEESPEPPPAERQGDRRCHMLLLSAKDETALENLAYRYAGYLEEHPRDLANVCYTAATGRAHFSHRLAIVAENAAEAVEKLARAGRGERPAGVARGRVDETRRPRVAFLFSGQGSQFAGMARDLYATQSTFRQALDRCDAILRDYLPQSLLAVIHDDRECKGNGSPSAATSPLDETRYTQPVLFALEYALYELWKSWGLEPDLMLGHSVGEYVAAWAAGVFGLEDAVKLVAGRGRLMQALPDGGAMMAVAADEATVRAALGQQNGGVDVAAVNSPQQTVLSGPAAAMRAVAAQLEAAGIRTSRLRVSHAFHSALMEPMLDAFERLCGEVTFSPPKRSLVSSVFGCLVGDEIATPQYWRRQIRETVRFQDGVTALDAQGADVYLELGPTPVLTSAARQSPPDRGQLWLPSLHSGREDWLVLLQSVAELHVRGVRLDWHGFERDYPRRKVLLPNYPFQRSRYWIGEATEGSASNCPVAAAKRGPSTAASLDDWFFEIQWQPR